MRLSSATAALKPSATLAMNELISERRRRGEQVLHMGFGESPFPVHPLIQKALCENASQRSYLPTQGILPLREQVSAFYDKMFGLHYSPDQIIVGPGSKALLFDALMALDGPVFLPAPSWVSYEQQARLSGKDVHHIETKREEAYRLNPAALDSAIQRHARQRDEQRILVLNYPCNPTGQTYSSSQLKALAAIARKQNLVILADEIYALLSFRNHEHHSIAEYYPEGTLVTGGLSKDRSAGGFRVGVILLPKQETKLKDAMLALAGANWSTVSAPIQYAAVEAYRPTPEIIQYIRDCTAIHELVTTSVHRRLVTQDIRCPAPEGAFYLFPDWNSDQAALKRQGIATSAALADALLREWNVASLPGEDFGMPTQDLCIRIATVDYDGAKALKRFTANRQNAWANPDRFATECASKVVAACDQLTRFTKAIRQERQASKTRKRVE